MAQILEDENTVLTEDGLNMADAEAIKTQGAADLNASNEMYDEMIADNKELGEQQKAAIDDWEAEQKDLANENYEFTIDQIEQQKAQEKQDYIKEQSGAYVDYQKATSEHGANAEQMAANGLTNTGYSESARVAMYNQYQNRVAVARSSYKQAVTDYNNAIHSARLQNNATLAEIASTALAQRLSAVVTFAQQGNSLLMQKANAAQQIKQTAHSNYLDVYDRVIAEAQGYGSGSEAEVNTAYYKGAKNADAAKYGTFSNGYQPKGISGHGKLSKSGDTIELATETLSGQKQTVVQNVWKAEDGTLWYWEGRQNKYLPIE